MDIKSLAKDLPLYGQMAIGTALRALAVAGHLRRVRCRVGGDGQCRWVTLTYWSRTAHDNEWWAARLAGEARHRPGAGTLSPSRRSCPSSALRSDPPATPPAPQGEPSAGTPTAAAGPFPRLPRPRRTRPQRTPPGALRRRLRRAGTARRRMVRARCQRRLPDLGAHRRTPRAHRITHRPGTPPPHRQDAAPPAHSRTAPARPAPPVHAAPGRVHRLRPPRPGRSAPGRPVPPLRDHAPAGGIVRDRSPGRGRTRRPGPRRGPPQPDAHSLRSRSATCRPRASWAITSPCSSSASTKSPSCGGPHRQLSGYVLPWAAGIPTYWSRAAGPKHFAPGGQSKSWLAPGSSRKYVHRAPAISRTTGPGSPSVRVARWCSTASPRTPRSRMASKWMPMRRSWSPDAGTHSGSFLLVMAMSIAVTA